MLNSYYFLIFPLLLEFGVPQQFEDIGYLTEARGVIVPLSNLFNLYHVGQIQVGRPSRTFVVLFDSGSTLSWIKIGCAANLSNCRNTTRFNFGIPLNKNFRIKYDDGGEIFGRMHRSWIQVEITSNNSIITQAEFGLALRVDPETNQRPYDGIIALGFQQQKNSHKQESVIEQVVRQVTHRLFTVHFKDAANAPNSIMHNAGQISFELVLLAITFGAVPTNGCSRRALFSPVFSTKDWQFQAISVKANGQKIDSGSIKIVADTGTSALLVPRQAYQRLLEALGLGPNCGPMPIVNCTQQVNLQIQLGVNESLTFTHKHLLLRYGQLCALQIAPAENLWLFGAPTFRQYCQIFDISRQRIGFAERL